MTHSFRFLTAAVLAVLSAASVQLAAAPAVGITITKATVNGDVTTKFHFAYVSPVDSGGVYLTDRESTLFGSSQSTYNITEDSLAGWDVTDISCLAQMQETTFAFPSSAHQAIISYHAGDIVTCTFTNEGGAPVPEFRAQVIILFLALIVSQIILKRKRFGFREKLWSNLHNGGERTEHVRNDGQSRKLGVKEAQSRLVIQMWSQE